MIGHVLDQAPAREDVDSLKPAADAEDRHAAPRCLLPRRLLEAVAVAVAVGRAVDRLVVESGVDVGSACQQQPGHPGQGAVPVRRRNRGRKQDGRAAVAPYAVGVELVLAAREMRVLGSGGVGDRNDDRGRGGRSLV